jgi:serine/threonine-protein phosphatase 5
MLPPTLTSEAVQQVLEEFKMQRKIHKRFVTQILLEAKKVLVNHKNLVEINVTSENELTVCGDVHGQYYDLLNIWQLNGIPSEKNMYLFNGDFVDRGSFSAEVIIAVRILTQNPPSTPPLTVF